MTYESLPQIQTAFLIIKLSIQRIFIDITIITFSSY